MRRSLLWISVEFFGKKFVDEILHYILPVVALALFLAQGFEETQQFSHLLDTACS